MPPPFPLPLPLRCRAPPRPTRAAAFNRQGLCMTFGPRNSLVQTSSRPSSKFQMCDERAQTSFFTDIAQTRANSTYLRTDRPDTGGLLPVISLVVRCIDADGQHLRYTSFHAADTRNPPLHSLNSIPCTTRKLYQTLLYPRVRTAVARAR
jgi:hypothetical protein